MKKHLSIFAGLVLGLAATGFAQQPAGQQLGAYGNTPTGTRELIFGGGGTSNTRFSDSYGAVNFSYGQYTTPSLLVALRQDVSYANPRHGSTAWNGATRIALDHHFPRTAGERPMRPFLGASFGRVYGDTVRDSWTAGLETGLKWYFHQRTFFQGDISYDWHFRRGRDIDNAFRSGHFGWGVGVGFNF